MSVQWGPSPGRGESAKRPVADDSRWEALAASFPEWTLEPPVIITRTRPDGSPG